MQYRRFCESYADRVSKKKKSSPGMRAGDNQEKGNQLKYLNPERDSGFDASQWMLFNSDAKSHAASKIAAILADHWNPQKGYSFPSIDTISKEARCSRSTVIRAIDSLASSEQWEIIKGGPKTNEDGSKGRNDHNKYIPLCWKVSRRSNGDLHINIDEDYSEKPGAEDELSRRRDYVARLINMYPKYFEKEPHEFLIDKFETSPNPEAFDVICHWVASQELKGMESILRAMNKDRERIFRTLIGPMREAREEARKAKAKDESERMW